MGWGNSFIPDVIENFKSSDEVPFRGDTLRTKFNKKPTHDPFTNPDATIYYECSCGQILDPDTRSFAELNNCASKAGWKIRFTDKGYVPYCVKCGEWVE